MRKIGLNEIKNRFQNMVYILRGGEELIVTDAPEYMQVPALTKDDQVIEGGVCEMAILSGLGEISGNVSLLSAGHSLLVLKNISDAPLNIAGFEVMPNKSLTLETWGNKTEHKGIWYNLEGYFQNYKMEAYDTVSLKTVLTQELMEVLNENIKNGDAWSLVNNNCAMFAVKLWNAVCLDKVSAGWSNTPHKLVKNIMKYTNNYFDGDTVPYDFPVHYGYPPQQSADFGH